MNDEPSVEIIARLTPAILRGLHALEFASRHVSPTTLGELIEAVASRNDDLAAALSASRDARWPERLEPVRLCLERAGDATLAGLTDFIAAAREPQPIVAAYRALRNYSRAAEALYPLAAHLKPVSKNDVVSLVINPALQSRVPAATMHAVDSLRTEMRAGRFSPKAASK